MFPRPRHNRPSTLSPPQLIPASISLNGGCRSERTPPPRAPVSSLTRPIISQGFFKGTSADQDRRFSDKELKLLKSIKFPPEFDKRVLCSSTPSPSPRAVAHVPLPATRKVDMRKVNIEVIRPWVAKKVVELVGFEDEVVVEYAMGLLEDESQPVRPPPFHVFSVSSFPEPTSLPLDARP